MPDATEPTTQSTGNEPVHFHSVEIPGVLSGDSPPSGGFPAPPPARSHVP